MDFAQQKGARKGGGLVRQRELGREEKMGGREVGIPRDEESRLEPRKEGG